MENQIDFNTFAGGAMAEQVNTELQKILKNIADPNTDAAKARKLTINITLKPNNNRDLSQMKIDTKAALAPIKGIETTIMIDKDLSTGNIFATEINKQLPGQMQLEDLPENEEGKVIDLKNAK